jgi:hypothetical protein
MGFLDFCRILTNFSLMRSHPLYPAILPGTRPGRCQILPCLFSQFLLPNPGPIRQGDDLAEIFVNLLTMGLVVFTKIG